MYIYFFIFLQFHIFYDTFYIYLFNETTDFAATLKTRLAIRSEPGLSCCTRLVKAWGTPVSAKGLAGHDI